MRTAHSLPCPGQGVSLDRDSPWSETPQTGSDIIQNTETPTLVDRQMPVKILPCPKLRLRAVNIVEEWIEYADDQMTSRLHILYSLCNNADGRGY